MAKRTHLCTDDLKKSPCKGKAVWWAWKPHRYDGSTPQPPHGMAPAVMRCQTHSLAWNPDWKRVTNREAEIILVMGS